LELKLELVSITTEVVKRLEYILKVILLQEAAIGKNFIIDDFALDQREIELDKRCISFLSDNQLLGKDLRFVVAVMRVNYLLKCMGDQIVEIVKELTLNRQTPIVSCYKEGLLKMGNAINAIVKHIVDAFVDENIDLALKIWRQAEEVDNMYKKNLEVTLNLIAQKTSVKQGAQIILIGQSLRTLTTLAINVAEQLVFVVRGHILPQGKELVEVEENRIKVEPSCLKI
jgi:phosphate transport system protein